MESSEPMAVLFSYDPMSGESTADPLVGVHTSGMDPITWAHALKGSIEGDFPGHLWAITGDDEAQELRRQYLVESVLGKPAPSDSSGASS
jgi:hypothetical protein